MHKRKRHNKLVGKNNKISLVDIEKMVTETINRRMLNEGEYEVYHNTYSDAISSALSFLEEKGYEPDEEDIWREISTGPIKPNDGDYNRFNISLYKNGKQVKEKAHIQVYGKGNRYELNIYIS